MIFRQTRRIFADIVELWREEPSSMAENQPKRHHLEDAKQALSYDTYDFTAHSRNFDSS